MDVSYEVPGTGGDGFGPTRRPFVHINPPLGLPTFNGVGRSSLTSFENFIHACDSFPEKKCLGYRSIDSKGEASAYKWISYRAVREHAESFSAGVLKLGLCPKSIGDAELREQGVLGIMMRNRPEWVFAEQSCYFQRNIPVPFYDTSKADTVSVILEKITSLTTVVCSALTIGELIKAKQSHPHLSLTTLVCADPLTPTMLASAQSAGLKCITFASVLEAGNSGPKPRHHPPSPDDIYTFCFTSGTTGEPKGVLITHRNIVANSAALSERLLPWVVGEEAILSFLPLPHMFERVAQLLAMCAGGAIGFYQGDALKLVDDLQALRPTRFVGVPRVLTRIQERVMAQIAQDGGFKERLFKAALGRKLRVPSDPLTAVSDRVIFRKVGVKLGLDRVKQILTGSAPIAPATLSWFRAVFPGVAVNEGYGQTECTLVCSLQSPTELTVGDCGGPLICCDVRLADVPDMGYRSSDREHGKPGSGTPPIPCLGRGEICIRGDNVFKGYYKMPEKTAEAIDKDGWLHTGDIGMWTTRGQIKVIDRIKNIFKLSQGEYVAPEKIEALFSTCKFVSQVLVYGDSVQNHLVAVVVPNPDTVKDWAAAAGLPFDLPALCKSRELKTVVLSELVSMSKRAKLNGFEIVKNIHLEPEMWTGDNLLTPTFKLKRKQAEIKYKPDIDRMYKEDASTATAGSVSKL